MRTGPRSLPSVKPPSSPLTWSAGPAAPERGVGAAPAAETARRNVAINRSARTATSSCARPQRRLHALGQHQLLRGDVDLHALALQLETGAGDAHATRCDDDAAVRFVVRGVGVHGVVAELHVDVALHLDALQLAVGEEHLAALTAQR